MRCMQALSVAELYGVLDTDTRDWTDGLLSNIFREINKPLPAGKVRPLKACCCDAKGIACQCSDCFCHLVCSDSWCYGMAS